MACCQFTRPSKGAKKDISAFIGVIQLWVVSPASSHRAPRTVHETRAVFVTEYQSSPSPGQGMWGTHTGNSKESVSVQRYLRVCDLHRHSFSPPLFETLALTVTRNQHFCLLTCAHVDRCAWSIYLHSCSHATCRSHPCVTLLLLPQYSLLSAVETIDAESGCLPISSDLVQSHLQIRKPHTTRVRHLKQNNESRSNA